MYIACSTGSKHVCGLCGVTVSGFRGAKFAAPPGTAVVRSDHTFNCMLSNAVSMQSTVQPAGRDRLCQ